MVKFVKLTPEIGQWQIPFSTASWIVFTQLQIWLFHFVEVDQNYLPQLVDVNTRWNPPAWLQKSIGYETRPSSSLTNGRIHLLVSARLIGGMIHIPSPRKSTRGQNLRSTGLWRLTDNGLRWFSKIQIDVAILWSAPDNASNSKSSELEFKYRSIDSE